MRWQRYSNIWKYFVDVQDDNGTKLVKCNTCNQMISQRQGNTGCMYDHLKKSHSQLYIEAARGRKVIQRKRKALRFSKKIVAAQSATLVEPKKEPADDDVYENTIVTQDIVDPLAPSSVPVTASNSMDSIQIIYNNVEVPLHSEEESEEPSTSHPDTSNTHSSAIENHKSKDDLHSTLCDITSNVTYLKELLTNSNDSFFYQSIAFELASLSEESRDLVKAAIWQIICQVKSAKRRNVELTPFNLFNKHN